MNQMTNTNQDLKVIAMIEEAKAKLQDVIEELSASYHFAAIEPPGGRSELAPQEDILGNITTLHKQYFAALRDCVEKSLGTDSIARACEGVTIPAAPKKRADRGDDASRSVAIPSLAQMKQSASEPSEDDDDEPVYTLPLGPNEQATGKETRDGFILQAGATFLPRENHRSLKVDARRRREVFLAMCLRQDDGMLFVKNDINVDTAARATLLIKGVEEGSKRWVDVYGEPYATQSGMGRDYAALTRAQIAGKYSAQRACRCTMESDTHRILIVSMSRTGVIYIKRPRLESLIAGDKNSRIVTLFNDHIIDIDAEWFYSHIKPSGESVRMPVKDLKDGTFELSPRTGKPSIVRAEPLRGL